MRTKDLPEMVVFRMKDDGELLGLGEGRVFLILGQCLQRPRGSLVLRS
jgi:hypothetical protein